MPAGLSKMEQLRWKKAHAGGSAAGGAAGPKAARPVPASAVATNGSVGASGEMPAGLSKMEQLRWRKANSGVAPSGAGTTAESAPRADTNAGSGSSSAEMPSGLSKMEQLRWRKLHGT